jgi:hypothetical protein
MENTERLQSGQPLDASGSSANQSRRNLLIGIMASVGVATTSGCVDSVEKSLTQAKSSASDPNLPLLQFYDAKQYKLVSILCNLIIPETNTQGALAVGVPLLMDTLYAEWASEDTQAKHKDAQVQVQQALDKLAGQDFNSASVKVQLAALNMLDEQAFSNNTSAAGSYRGIKSLIARFYYFSEVGASKELRYELVPGKWEPCVPMEEIGRTWSA